MARITIVIDDLDFPDHDDPRPWTAYIENSDVEAIANIEAGLGATPREAVASLVENIGNWEED